MPNTQLATRKPRAGNIAAEDHIARMVVKARAALALYATDIAAHGQARIDEAVTALAWSIYKPQNARRLAEIAVDVTGIGEVESKVVKNQRKTFGTLRDLLRVKSTGIIEQIPEKGIVKYAKPVGVVELVDLVVVTGSQVNVRGAYKSGKPAIGVGLGNAPVIIDASADLADAARKIMLSKTFDHATSCSSENAVVIVGAVYDAAVAALEKEGGYLASPAERKRIVERLWQDGKLNRAVIAQGPQALIEVFELGAKAKGCKFVMVPEKGIGKDYPLSGEKLSLVLTVYRAKDFAHAKRIVRDILEYQGKGHSCGIHTEDLEHARELAEDIDVVRVLVNQAHTFGNGGGFDNGLPFTLSMGCGTWQGNSISDNLNWRCFINVTHLVMTIPEDKPSEEALFGAYWAKYGK
jgi:sulfoacetaldehyde dehydrogenase